MTLALPPVGYPPGWGALYEGCERFLPGDDETLREVLREASIPPRPRTLLLAAGRGASAAYVAARTGGRVTALVNERSFMSELAARARAADVADLVDARELDLPAVSGGLAGERFDLVISEGALPGMGGFARGLAGVTGLLTDGGVLALLERAWVAPPPPALRAFYDAMLGGTAPLDLDAMVVRLGEAGFGGGVSWPLSKARWDAFYAPLRRNVERLRAKGEGGPLVEHMERELKLYDLAGGPRYLGVIALVTQRQEALEEEDGEEADAATADGSDGGEGSRAATVAPVLDVPGRVLPRRGGRK